jgi:hypothetical protein
MKRSILLLFSCLAIAGSIWLAHVVWGQTAETKEKTFTITQSQLDDYVAKKVVKALADEHQADEYIAKKVAKALADEREKAAKDKAAVEEQIFSPQSWHMATYNNAVYMVYTGPGQFMLHHWVQPGKTPGSATPPASSAPKSGPATTPKGGTTAPASPR